MGKTKLPLGTIPVIYILLLGITHRHEYLAIFKLMNLDKYNILIHGIYLKNYCTGGSQLPLGPIFGRSRGQTKSPEGGLVFQ